MKLLVSLMILALPCFASAQTVTLKRGLFSVDGKPYLYSKFKYKKGETADFTNLNGVVCFTATTRVDKVNMSGTVAILRYAVLRFNKGKTVLYSTKSSIQMVKDIYLCDCMQPNGTIDVKKLLASSNTFTESAVVY